jgi:DNA (cytosine-5)-methyltransferase 1
MKPDPAELREAAIRPSWQAYRVLTGKEQHKHFGLIRLDLERPCPTIPKSMGGSTTGLVHPTEIRRIAISEAKALASFPAAFTLVGSYEERWARIGNSVPPLFMRAVATNLRAMLMQD